MMNKRRIGIGMMTLTVPTRGGWLVRDLEPWPIKGVAWAESNAWMRESRLLSIHIRLNVNDADFLTAGK